MDVRFHNPDVSLYLTRARRSRWGSASKPMNSVSASDHCLVDDEIRGTVITDADDSVGRFDVRVRHFDDNRKIIGRGFTTPLCWLLANPVISTLHSTTPSAG